MVPKGSLFIFQSTPTFPVAFNWISNSFFIGIESSRNFNLQVLNLQISNWCGSPNRSWMLFPYSRRISSANREKRPLAQYSLMIFAFSVRCWFVGSRFSHFRVWVISSEISCRVFGIISRFFLPAKIVPPKDLPWLCLAKEIHAHAINSPKGLRFEYWKESSWVFFNPLENTYSLDFRPKADSVIHNWLWVAL